jgi:protein-S-isoprenylcysteine O-methyltransferase Ste14
METVGASVVPWWRGRRGEWYVAIQAGLFLLIALGPHTAPWLPAWSPDAGRVASVIGSVLMTGGLLWIVAGAAQLGRSLSALPYPKDAGKLIDTGVFGLVRHPMYCGAIWVAVGWALQTQGLLTLGYAVVMTVFLDLKASREERWLSGRFPEYGNYQARVRKLIPFVY